MTYTVYILKCADDTLYTGSSKNLEQRIYAHNNLKSGAHYTKIRRPVELVYSQECDSLSAARSREAEIKSLSRDEKMRLIDE